MCVRRGPEYTAKARKQPAAKTIHCRGKVVLSESNGSKAVANAARDLAEIESDQLDSDHG
jgi:hypothetical protein